VPRVNITLTKPNCQKELNLVGSGPVVVTLKPNIILELDFVQNHIIYSK